MGYQPGTTVISEKHRERSREATSRARKGKKSPQYKIDAGHPLYSNPARDASLAKKDNLVRLMAAMLIRAIDDMVQTVDYGLAHDAYQWLIADGPLYAEHLEFSTDVREWAMDEFPKVWTDKRVSAWLRNGTTMTQSEASKHARAGAARRNIMRNVA